MGSGILFFFSWVEVGLLSVEWFCFISFFLYTFLCAFLCFSFMWVVSSLAFLFMQIIFLKKKWRVIHNLRTEICVFFMCCYSKLCVGRQHGLNDSVGHVPKMSFDRLFFFVHGFKSLVQIFFIAIHCLCYNSCWCCIGPNQEIKFEFALHVLVSMDE